MVSDIMFPYSKSSKQRQISAGKSEGRFVEPSQLHLSPSGSVVEKAVVRPVERPEILDFRITKDAGFVKPAETVFGPHPSSRRVASSEATSFERRNSGRKVSDLEVTNEKPPTDTSSRGSSADTTDRSDRSQGADRIVFADTDASGSPVIYRTPEEKAANPDRINLDRRKLLLCPVLHGEERLRLLNYQHNRIRCIDNMDALRSLIFLDLYDNEIEEISGLAQLRSLRVLMLGKNRIKRIENLENLSKLDVLDLHGNEITVLQNLSHLSELRLLNLAGNRISNIESLEGLATLAELNLRRNKISVIHDIRQLPSLQRLFLSFNVIMRFEDIQCVADSPTLRELSLDGNPFTTDSHYKQTVLKNMQSLKQFDMKRVTDEERRMALVIARKEEDRRKELRKVAAMKEKRKLAITNAKRQWEVMQTTLMGKTNRLIGPNLRHGGAGGSVGNPELHADHLGTYTTSGTSGSSRQQWGDSSDLNSAEGPLSALLSSSLNYGEGDEGEDKFPTLGPLRRPMSAVTNGSLGGNNYLGQRERNAERLPNKHRSHSESRVPPQGLLRKEKMIGPFGSDETTSDIAMDYCVEIDGDTLHFMGPNSISSLDKNWGIQAAANVTTIVFKFVDINEIILKAFPKIRSRFPAVHTYVFIENGIETFQQLNALAGLRRIDNLTIQPNGNPVTSLALWKSYVIFRLAHFNLKTLNNEEVQAQQIVSAEKSFGPIAVGVTTKLQLSRLPCLVNEIRRKQLVSSQQQQGVDKPSGASPEHTPSKTTGQQGGESLGRAALGYISAETAKRMAEEYSVRMSCSKQLLRELTDEAVVADSLSHHLTIIWPQVFEELLRRVLSDTLEMDGTVSCKRQLEQLMSEGSISAR